MRTRTVVAKMLEPFRRPMTPTSSGGEEEFQRFFKARKMGLSRKDAMDFVKVTDAESGESGHVPAVKHALGTSDLHTGSCSCGWEADSPQSEEDAVTAAVRHAAAHLPVADALVERARSELLDIKSDLENG